MTTAIRDDVRPLVVVGASAGGVQALSVFASNLPPDFPAPIVVAMHLDPHRTSHLDAILERQGPLPVVLVSQETPLEPGRIYVVPSNRHVVIRDGKVLPESDHASRPRPSVDLLLSTAASYYGEHLIAVILTGYGSDGASGAVAVKESGGTVVIQNPRTAAHPSMPMALPPTVVDHVADLEDMGRLLGAVLAGTDLPDRVGESGRNVLQAILEHAGRTNSVDFTQYKPTTLLRRIARRMAVLHLKTLEQYRDHVDAHPQEADELVRSLLIQVTQFFRDPEAFELIEREVLPTLIERGRERGRTLRVWSAGCATGEEAYSLALVIAKVLGAELSEWSVRIFATDVDDQAIHFARQGFYPKGLLQKVPPDMLERHFEPVDLGYRIQKSLRQTVVFGQQDVARGAPFPRVDLVVCRNLLIYFKPELQQDVLDVFAYSLHQTNGFLVLGKAETVRPSKSVYEVVDKKWKIYRCVKGPQPGSIRLETATVRGGHETRTPRPALHHDGVEAEPHGDGVELRDLRRVNEILMRTLPVGLAIIDRNYSVQSLNPTARRLLGIRENVIEQDFLHAAQNLPYRDVRAAIDQVFRERATVVLHDVELVGSSGGRHVAINVFPVEAANHDMVVVSLIDVTEHIQTRRRLENVEAEQKTLGEELASNNRRLGDMNKELQDANEELQAVNEEMMLSQEELQATNEEFEATNEELQATNEELETNNEELQAANEELETINDELQARTHELQEMTSSLSGERRRLAEMVELSPLLIVVLRGTDLRVESVDPRSGDLFAPGRSHATLDEMFAGAALEPLRDGVRLALIENRIWRSAPIQFPDKGRYYEFTAVPSRANEVVDGVVLYAEDVTERLQELGRERLERLRLIVEHADQVAMALFDGRSGRMLHASKRYVRMLRRLLAPRQETGGLSWSDLWFGTPETTDSFAEVVRTQEPAHLRELRVEEEQGTSIWDCTLVPIPGEEPTGDFFVAVIAVEVTNSVTDREHLEQLDRLKDDFLSLASHELRTPLTPLTAYIEMLSRLLEERQRGPEWQGRATDLVTKFKRQVRYMSRLIDDLMDVARLQSGKFSLDLKQVNLIKIVEEAKEQATMISSKPPIRLEVRAPGELRIRGDEIRLIQVIYNLLANALKHAASSPEIVIGVDVASWSEGKMARIRVTDKGPGVPLEVREKLFHRFFQAAPRESRTARSGLGLGLFISARIIEQHGGRIGADFTDPGATFWIELPLL